MSAKKSAVVDYLEREADRFKQLAKDAALRALHAGDGLNINALDARMIRDHEVRAETYRAAARIAEGHHT